MRECVSSSRRLRTDSEVENMGVVGCVHVCVSVHQFICGRICLCVCVRVCVCTMCVYTSAWACVCRCLPACVHICVGVWLCSYVCARVYQSVSVWMGVCNHRRVYGCCCVCPMVGVCVCLSIYPYYVLHFNWFNKGLNGVVLLPDKLPRLFNYLH